MEPYKMNELYHYGVKGMRWGVRRASRQLSNATTPKKRDKAVSSLEKHKKKGTAEVRKLEKKRPKLDDRLKTATVKDRAKANKLEKKASKLDRKAAKNIWKSSSLLRSEERSKALQDEAEYYQAKANKLHTKASVLNNNYVRAKSKVESNELLTNLFKKEIKNIDRILSENGRRYING